MSAQLPRVGEDAADPILRAVLGRIRSATGHVANIYRVLGNSPELLEAWIDFAWTLRFQPKVPRHLRELAIVRVALMTETPYELAAHTDMALEAGVRHDQLESIASWRESDSFDVDEQLVLDATEVLTATTELPDATRAQLLEQFGPEGTVELVLTIAFYSCVSRVLKGLGVPLEVTPADDNTS